MGNSCGATLLFAVFSGAMLVVFSEELEGAWIKRPANNVWKVFMTVLFSMVKRFLEASKAYPNCANAINTSLVRQKNIPETRTTITRISVGPHTFPVSLLDSMDSFFIVFIIGKNCHFGSH